MKRVIVKHQILFLSVCLFVFFACGGDTPSAGAELSPDEEAAAAAFVLTEDNEVDQDEDEDSPTASEPAKEKPTVIIDQDVLAPRIARSPFAELEGCVGWKQEEPVSKVCCQNVVARYNTMLAKPENYPDYDLAVVQTEDPYLNRCKTRYPKVFDSVEEQDTDGGW